MEITDNQRKAVKQVYEFSANFLINERKCRVEIIKKIESRGFDESLFLMD